MTGDELLCQIRHAFAFEPTSGQLAAMDVFRRFVTSTDDRTVMIMRGAAGTGKTSVAGAIVRALRALHQKIVLLAPTGRAAKVFALNADCQAFTIHRRIYRQKAFTGDMSGFQLGVNTQRDTLFIVDEASMIANRQSAEGAFGGGCLLDDLVSYVYSTDGCRMMLIGDTAQLPPVGEDASPALSSAFMSGYGLQVYDCNIDEVLRQSYGSGILFNATVIRRMILSDGSVILPKIRFHGFADIETVSGGDLVERLADSYAGVGMDDTTVITRSNKRAGIYNNGIRAMVLDREESLSRGDMLMVVKNNYFWKAKNEILTTDSQLSTPNSQLPTKESSFIANGDRAKVMRVRNIREMYGLTFADATLSFPDYDDMELKATVILDTLTTDAPALTREQQDALFHGVLADYDDLARKTDRMKAVKEDPYYNALQVKYAYAVTCHKAQGGQWAHVYIDQGYMTDDMLTPSYIHWLYTAFTRATEKLFLVNWPKQQIENPT